MCSFMSSIGDRSWWHKEQRKRQNRKTNMARLVLKKKIIQIKTETGHTDNFKKNINKLKKNP